MENIVFHSQNALNILIPLVVIKVLMVFVDGLLNKLIKNQNVKYSDIVMKF